MDPEIMKDNHALYRALYRIRRFEETVLDNFPKGVFVGTTHTYLGQEANAVGVLAHTLATDVVMSNHRCHGHFLAYGGDMRALFAELMGRSTGVSGGRGGSQHLHWRGFYSNGVLGGIAPIAVGMAVAEKAKRTGGIAFVFLGDGALGEGVVYEALNIAALWRAPVLLVLENNRIAQTTPIELHLSGRIGPRFEAFDIPTLELDTCDVIAVRSAATRLVAEVRSESAPRALILHTHRFGPHSKGDDTRPENDLAQIRRDRDPVQAQAARLGSGTRAEIQAEVDEEVRLAFETAKDDPFPVLIR
jgi:TPP-dependent pyruvate/acetoin dehydrogenase alpha subunit